MTATPQEGTPLWPDRYLTHGRIDIRQGSSARRVSREGPSRLQLLGRQWRRMSRRQQWVVAVVIAVIAGAPLQGSFPDLATSISLGVLGLIGVLVLASRETAAPAAPAPAGPEASLAAADTTEARIAGAASRAWRETLREPSWQSPFLATSRAAFDGQAEVDQIVDIAVRIYRARVTLGVRPDGPAAEYWTRQHQALERAAHRLGRRADALIRYRDQAARLSQELGHLADLERLERSAAEIDGLTIETAHRSGRGDVRIDQLAEEMAAVRTAMTELVDLMTSTRAPLAEPPDRAQPL